MAKLSNIKLKKKINLIILSFIVPIFVLLFLSFGNFILQVNKDIDNKKKISENSVKNAIELHKTQRIIGAYTISTNPFVQEKVLELNSLEANEIEKENILAEKLNKLHRFAKVEFSWIYDKNGRIVARGHKPTEKKFSIEKDDPLFENAMMGDVVYTIETPKKGLLFFKYAVPIYQGSTVIGVCVVGEKIGKGISPAFAHRIREISGVEILIVAENNLISASFGIPLETGDKNISFPITTNEANINEINYDITFFQVWDAPHIKNFRVGIAIDNSKIRQSLKDTLIIMFIIFIASGLVSYILSRKISSNIAKSTNAIMEGAKHIGDKNFNYEIKLIGKDELAQLANTFNSMTSEIRQYSENLEDLVSKRTRQLNRANEELAYANNQMKKDLEMAKQIQQTIIPKIYPENQNINMDGIYLPMEDLGGDYYDIFKITETKLGIVIVDVSGHGVSSALITTMAKMSFQSHSYKENLDAGQIVKLVNRDMVTIIGNISDYLTAYYAILDLENGEFQFVNAGHLPAIHYHQNSNKITQLDSKGFYIGIVEDVPFEKGSIHLEIGDRILLYTDGITETRNSDGILYGEERLIEYVEKNSSINLAHFIEGIIEEIDKFSGYKGAQDDRAILCIEMVKNLGKDETIEDAVKVAGGIQIGKETNQ